MIIYFIILLLSLNLLLGTLLFYALRRIDNYEKFIIQISQIIEYTNNKLEELDHAGHFESDDEVGFFFEQIKNIQSMMNDIFEIDNKENDAEKKEK
jgi:Asp-tRNA(Asn)/Glu-tRNA(Gln) amidotransferase C subunit